jgi:hypothetical protein
MNVLRPIMLLACAIALPLMAASAQAQTGVLNYWQTASGDWNTPSNWSLGSVPDGQATDDFAIVGGVNLTQGVAIGVANVTNNVSSMPGGVILGLAAGNSGTLNIANGGSLVIADTLFDGDGSLQVGINGEAILTVARGGSLSAVSIATGGANTTAVRLGAGAAGTATLTVQNANFGRETRITGPNVNFTATNAITLRGTNNLIAEITSPTTHSPLKAGFLVELGGALTVQFAPGITPAAGDAWNLFDANNVAGAFATINTAAAPDLDLGQIYAVRTQNGGVNGKLVQLAVEQRLVLNVNRGTGAASISNPAGGSLPIDGYSIRSATVGSLNQANWQEIGGDWQVANASPNQLNEVNPDSTTAITTTPRALGNIFTPPAPAAFGDPTEDLLFEYTLPGQTAVAGIVNYTGTGGLNTLALVIDPATGNGQIHNPSGFTVDVDGYTISSATGALDVAGWSSLDDRNAAGGDWNEANVDQFRISEVKVDEATTLSSGAVLGSAGLGSLFTEAGGKKDLVFEFLLENESTPRTGVVVYEAVTIPGDFDANGVVNAADLAQWKGDFGTGPGSDADGDGDTDGRDFLAWQRNLGAGSPATPVAQSIPEPASLALMIGVGCVVGLSRRVPLLARPAVGAVYTLRTAGQASSGAQVRFAI